MQPFLLCQADRPLHYNTVLQFCHFACVAHLSATLQGGWRGCPLQSCCTRSTVAWGPSWSVLWRHLVRVFGHGGTAAVWNGAC